jgi:hypothetical protein
MIAMVAMICLGIADGNAKEVTQEDKLKVSFLKIEIGKIENEVASAEKTVSEGSKGLLPALVKSRIETDKLTISILRQHVAALESGSEITISVPAIAPDPTLAASLEIEVENANSDLEKARKESAQYSSGLIKTTIDARAATQELTISSLKQKFLAAKYGLMIPAISAPKTNEPRQVAPRLAEEGSASKAHVELDQEEIEKLKENQSVSVESAYFYKGSYGILNGITVIVKNNTDQVVKEYSVTILGYDADGFPLRIGSSSVQIQGTSKNCNIKPNKTYGKDSYFSIRNHEDEVKKILACVSSVTYYDGTTWENPYYKYWLEKFEDKPIPVPAPPAKSSPAKADPTQNRPSAKQTPGKAK